MSKYWLFVKTKDVPCGLKRKINTIFFFVNRISQKGGGEKGGAGDLGKIPNKCRFFLTSPLFRDALMWENVCFFYNSYKMEGVQTPLYKSLGNFWFVLWAARKPTENRQKPPERRPKPAQTCIKRGWWGQRPFITVITYRHTDVFIREGVP